MEKHSSEEVLDFASEAGRILLENGAEISRVEETMERIAGHYGEKGEKFFVLSNGIFTTGKSYANAEFIPIKGSRLDKVVEVNQLSRDIASDNLSLSQARKRLEQIKAMPGKPVWEQYLGAAFGCFGFCCIFGGSLMDCLASLVAAVILHAFMLYVGNPYLTKALGNICAGLIGTFLCIGFHALGFGEHLGNMVVGTMILLIPGVAFTNGLRDIGNEDYLAGITRLLDALMMFLCIAIGVCLSFIIHGWFAGGVIQLTGALTDHFMSSYPIQAIAALVGTSAFAILFGAPRKHYLSAGVVGMVGWMVYLAFLRLTPVGPTAATFFGATVVAFLSRHFAVLFKCPSTVFLICGAFPMIPGGGVFWAAYYISSGQLEAALNSGILSIKITIAIVLGIIISANVFNRRK